MQLAAVPFAQLKPRVPRQAGGEAENAATAQDAPVKSSVGLSCLCGVPMHGHPCMRSPLHQVYDQAPKAAAQEALPDELYVSLYGFPVLSWPCVFAVPTFAQNNAAD